MGTETARRASCSERWTTRAMIKSLHVLQKLTQGIHVDGSRKSNTDLKHRLEKVMGDAEKPTFDHLKKKKKVNVMNERQKRERDGSQTQGVKFDWIVHPQINTRMNKNSYGRDDWDKWQTLK